MVWSAETEVQLGQWPLASGHEAHGGLPNLGEGTRKASRGGEF